MVFSTRNTFQALVARFYLRFVDPWKQILKFFWFHNSNYFLALCWMPGSPSWPLPNWLMSRSLVTASVHLVVLPHDLLQDNQAEVTDPISPMVADHQSLTSDKLSNQNPRFSQIGQIPRWGQSDWSNPDILYMTGNDNPDTKLRRGQIVHRSLVFSY